MRLFVGALAAALTFLTVSPTNVRAPAFDPSVSVDTGHLIPSVAGSASGTQLQVPVNYACAQGQLAQIQVVITQGSQSAEPGGAASESTLANTPVLPVCTGGSQNYVIYLTTLNGPMVAGTASYTATLFAASPQPWPSSPGVPIGAAGPSAMTLDTSTLPPVNMPTVVANAVVSELASTSVTVSWGPPVSDGGEAISGFDVVCQSCSSGPTGQLVSETSATFSGLNPSQQYLFAISAINGAGQGPPVTVAAVTTSPPGPSEPDPVNDLQLGAITAHLIVILWTPPSDAAEEAITGYIVGRNGSDTNGYGVYSNTLPSSARSFTFIFLYADTTYNISITPIYSSGQGTPKTLSVKTAALMGAVTPQVVTLSASPQNLQSRQALSVAVAVLPAHGPQVIVEFLDGRNWVKGTLLPLAGRYGYTYYPGAGTYILRAVALASPGYTQGVSPDVTVHVFPYVPPLGCTASVSNSHPKRGSTIDVNVVTAAGADVATTVHFVPASVARTRRANGRGVASIAYKISRTAPARAVPVTVTVTLGPRVGACSTSFTPR